MDDELDLLDVRRVVRDPRADAGEVAGGRVALHVDVEQHAAADGVRGAGGGLHHRDEDAEHQQRDEHAGHRGEARDRVAPDRAQRLLDEEPGPHRQASSTSSNGSFGIALALAAHQRAELGMWDSAARSPAVHRVGLVAHDPAALELDHAAAHAVDHVRVVRGDQHGRAGAVDPVQQLHDPDRGLGIEVAGRLVGEQQRRVVDERARHRDALLLAAGELVGVVVQLRRQAREAQDVGHLRADLLARAAGHLQRVGDVVVDRAVGQELEVLEDHAQVAPVVGHLLVLDLAEIAPGDHDAPARRLVLLEQQAHDRRLARAGLADDEDELAAGDRERRVLQADVPGLVGLGDAAELDDAVRVRVSVRGQSKVFALDLGRSHHRTRYWPKLAIPASCKGTCTRLCSVLSNGQDHLGDPRQRAPTAPHLHPRHPRRDRARRLRRRRAHRAPRGERDGPLSGASRLQGRREVRRLPQGQRDGRADGRDAQRLHLARPGRVPHHLPRRDGRGGHRPADRLRRAPEDRPGGARSRARRGDPGDPALQGPAGGRGRGARRPGRLRRPPARAHRARARGAPARPSPATRSSASASAAGRDRAARRSSSATSSTPTARRPSCSRASPRCPRPSPYEPAPGVRARPASSPSATPTSRTCG